MSGEMNNISVKETKYPLYKKPAPAPDTHDGILRMTATHIEFKESVKTAGIVGAGGAGFPSYAKIADGVDTILINGAECESLLYTDYVLMRDELRKVVEGIDHVVTNTTAKKGLLCVKEHTGKELGFFDGQKLSEHTFVKFLPNVYPMGDEVSLIYEATGRSIKPGSLPISVGVIVYNVETVFDIREALKHRIAVTHKWLTVGGNTEKSFVVRVPVGMYVKELLEMLGVSVPKGNVVLDGGPAMGRVIDHERAAVTKTTKSILILPESLPIIQSKMTSLDVQVRRGTSACCQCTRCTDLCPRNQLGYPLEPHKLVRAAQGAGIVDPKIFATATLCCGCGICEHAACGQGLSPRAMIFKLKDDLAKNKTRYISDETISPRDTRDYRLISSERWKEIIGVSKYDKKAEFIDKDFAPSRVEISMRGHIGAPSVPCVEKGQAVALGEKIADAADGLSLPQYASISGVCRRVDSDKIIIERI
ncbi:MAG: 4Fe-4S dicluster domain-containing protein [Clostridia bacterium]|nr:4Fe-4S dicluster domain-containing protein [Clostridia bacterium]